MRSRWHKSIEGSLDNGTRGPYDPTDRGNTRRGRRPSAMVWCRPIMSLPADLERNRFARGGRRTEKLSYVSSHKMYFIATHDLFRRFGSYPLLRIHQRNLVKPIMTVSLAVLSFHSLSYQGHATLPAIEKTGVLRGSRFSTPVNKLARSRSN